MSEEQTLPRWAKVPDSLKDCVGLGRFALDLDRQDTEQDDLDGGA